MKFAVLVTLLIIVSSLIMTTAITVSSYVFGTTAFMISGPRPDTAMEGSIKLSSVKPPATIVSTAPPTTVGKQVIRTNAETMKASNYLKILEYCSLTCRVDVEMRLVGKPQSGSISVNGYVVVGGDRKYFRLTTSGLVATHMLLTNTSCANNLTIVITGIKVSTSNKATLSTVSLSYLVRTSSNVVHDAATPLLTMQALLTVAALSLLVTTRAMCRKYFSQ